LAILKPVEGPRINRDIRVPEVRLIAENGEQIGIVPIQEALRRAEEASLDLVEVAPEAKPPVCRIYDYKKVLYEKKKKLKESRKKTSQSQEKEIKLRVAIDPHDRKFKVNHAREFLTKGDTVKFTITFKGREITKPELGEKLIKAVKEELADIGEVIQDTSRMGRQLIMRMARRKDWHPPKPSAPPAPAAAANPEGKKAGKAPAAPKEPKAE
jgi:translation initiation factor IF-3